MGPPCDLNLAVRQSRGLHKAQVLGLHKAQMLGAESGLVFRHLFHALGAALART